MLCSSQTLILAVVIGCVISLLPATEVCLLELYPVNIYLGFSHNTHYLRR